MNDDTPSLCLANSRTDNILAFARGVLGQVPVFGSLISELLTTIIPNQRIDRITRFLTVLHQKLGALGEDVARQKLSHPDAVGLLEDSFLLAYRAQTDIRREHIASVVKNGISSTKLRIFEAKRVLSILDQLNDAEIMILHRYAIVFALPHSTEEPPSLTASNEQRDSRAIQESYHAHLEQLGLVNSDLEVEKDAWGNDSVRKGTRPRITPLGKAVVRFLDGPVFE